MSPAQKQLQQIAGGVEIISRKDPEASLVALDKNLCCSGPIGPNPADLSEAELMALEGFGWEWNDEQDTWEFYTGHG